MEDRYEKHKHRDSSRHKHKHKHHSSDRDRPKRDSDKYDSCKDKPSRSDRDSLRDNESDRKRSYTSSDDHTSPAKKYSRAHETEHSSVHTHGSDKRKRTGYDTHSSKSGSRHSSSSSKCERSHREDHEREDSKEKGHEKQGNDSDEDDEPGPGEPGPDHEFDWEQHRRSLDKLFFHERNAIKRGTQQYDDFWSFLTKYLQFQRRKAGSRLSSTKQDRPAGKLGLPQKYSQIYKVNFSLAKSVGVYSSTEIDGTTKRHSKSSQELTDVRITQFRHILLYYLDFCNKQKVTKLQKLQKDQMNLPIYQYKKPILEAVNEYPIIVVAGDTGCGKSTQVPQYLLEAGYAQIACTQPRRIACISLSKRVAYETLNEYGTQVGYQVRFEKSKTKATRILFLTEGLLLRQMSTDPVLSRYSVVVIDEVHERHLHTDFLLGIFKYLLKQRSDLKLVLMSATININLFSDFFDSCPVIKIPGRLHPIHVSYLPVSIEEQGSKSERLDPAPYVRILQRIDHKYPSTERGDVLMFLSGMSEIMSVVEAASGYAEHTKMWIILPLHSALSVDDQDKVFDIAPEGVRKCIVSTNIAETSVTIDGVRFVVDSGKVKEMSFDTKYKMQKLQEFWISRASAEQRKGRSGRTGPGVCFRLYDESDYNSLQEYATPEVQRVPLDSLILQMFSMGLPDARKFPFIEPPSDFSIENSINLLKEQGAITLEEKLTPLGEMLAQLPVDIVIGKMLIMGSIFHMVDPILSVAAALSVQSPFTTKAFRDFDAMSARKSLESDHGDPFTLLNAFDEWVQVKASGEASRKWCKRRGLEEQRFYDMSKLKNQFSGILKEAGLIEKPEKDSYQELTALQRRQKHADRKKLQKLRREHNTQMRKRKVLKLEESYDLSGGEMDEAVEEEEADTGTQLKDLEFRLTHNLDKLLGSSARGWSLREVNLLKIILCSGLYPQVAISDEHNSFKKDSEQAYHTKNKAFTIIHPTSVFTTNPEALQLQDKDIVEDIRATSNSSVFSNRHQLLAYTSVLETHKPFLIGSMRVPALQILLLCAGSMDTNADLTRIVCDAWLEIQFKDGETSEAAVSSAMQLRSLWSTLIEYKLQQKSDRHDDDKDITAADVKQRKIQKLLGKKLPEFLASDYVYAVRRIMTAELQHTYLGPDRAGSVPDAVKDIFTATGQPHPIKGGYQVNTYLVYNCLADIDSSGDHYASCMQRHWTCPTCDTQLIVTVMQKLQHQHECQSAKAEGSKEEEPVKKESTVGKKSYHCTVCDQDFMFSTIEIFKHKKSCTGKT